MKMAKKNRKRNERETERKRNKRKYRKVNNKIWNENKRGHSKWYGECDVLGSLSGFITPGNVSWSFITMFLFIVCFINEYFFRVCLLSTDFTLGGSQSWRVNQCTTISNRCCFFFHRFSFLGFVRTFSIEKNKLVTFYDRQSNSELPPVTMNGWFHGEHDWASNSTRTSSGTCAGQIVGSL